ncbi:hypothetical protein C8J56DRAFT_301392 [Mycena floridula]|nr:hypothetical protein C8J56DRAFT_301392 [Mycena floridula]
MATVPAPTLVDREEWPDADFDLPEGQTIHAAADKEDDEDWDLEMDLGKTGGAKAPSISQVVDSSQSQMFIIRPPAPPSFDEIGDDDDEDEGVSTIKLAFPKSSKKDIILDDDFEDAFALPSDLTQLSLAPLSLNHRASKSSIEWGGDKDHTSSSQSSDAYSSLGFADASPSSNSTSSASLPETETEDDDDEEGALEGLVIPSDLFDSGKGGRHLTKLLEMKKAAVVATSQTKVAGPDPEDDFEMGLIIDDDIDLSPSRLLSNTKQSHRTVNRTLSMPIQRLRPPSRLKPDRAKSPVNPPPSSTRQLQKLRLSPSPPLRPRTQTFQPLSSAPSSASTSFLAPKSTNLRGQKSHSGLKPCSPPPSDVRRLPRKASLSSLMESSQSQASGSGAGPSDKAKARYEEPTAASRAKSHKSSLGRLDFKVPPTRPSTPSNNPAALRLTMPTQSRLRTRPTLSSVGWNPPMSPSAPSPSFRTSSPLPRPPSNLSMRPTRAQTVPTVPVLPSARVLKRPKRARLFGDGTELDGIDDLPTDRDQESRFRVQPKGYGNRIPGGSYSVKPSERGTIRKKGRREPSASSYVVSALAPATNAPKRPPKPDSSPKKKKTTPSPASRRKPTLIRNLSGVGSARVVGDMKWNPQALRWEGNEHVLRDFDAVVTSTRPALITHLTGSSIGSPVGAFASGARIVGNMIFDPKRMCWLSTLPPEEDEPDVFANLADDEEDDHSWESRGGTIRATLQASSTSSMGSIGPSFNATVEAPSPARSHISTGDSDRGSRGSMVCDPDSAFTQRCRSAEERHKLEMKGWRTSSDVFAAPNRTHLYEIRAVATRSYSS